MALLRSFALIAAAAFLLTACSRSPVVQLYEGAKQPDSQVLTIRVPSDLEVFTINGSEVDGVNTFFNTDHKDLKVTPGRYEILAYYKRLWDLDADSHEVMKSDPALFVVDGKAGEFYRLDFERPQNVTQARALEEDFSGWVENMNSGEKTPSQASGLVLNRGFLAPITGTEVETKGSTSVQPKAAEAVTPAPAAPAASATAKSSTAGNAGGEASASGQASYLDTLKAQWNQATQEERRQFLQWISR